MDEGKVLIVDLGNCDGETRRLSDLIVTGIEMAALSRKDQTTRRPFYLFLMSSRTSAPTKRRQDTRPDSLRVPEVSGCICISPTRL